MAAAAAAAASQLKLLLLLLILADGGASTHDSFVAAERPWALRDEVTARAKPLMLATAEQKQEQRASVAVPELGCLHKASTSALYPAFSLKYQQFRCNQGVVHGDDKGSSDSAT